MLICNHQLSEEQLSHLEKLRWQCKAHDGNRIANYPHLLNQNRPMACNLLSYQSDQLVGFLSVFFFYEDAAEIILMVAPSSRRQGLATQLINEILPLLLLQRIKTLIVSTPSRMNNHHLLAQGFHYQGSEYQMQRLQQSTIPVANPLLKVRLATDADLEILCAIDNTCFPKKSPNMPSHFYDRLHDVSYQLLLAEINGIPIGKAHLHFQAGKTRLTDLAILPEHQGCGLGGALLAYCINYSLAHHPATMILHVESSNEKALKLYKQVGFIVENAYDFWSIPIEVLRSAKH